MVTQKLFDKASQITYNGREDYSKIRHLVKHIPTEYTRHLISPENLAKIEELEQMIISGDLEAPEEGIVRGRCASPGRLD